MSTTSYQNKINDLSKSLTNTQHNEDEIQIIVNMLLNLSQEKGYRNGYNKGFNDAIKL